MLQQNRNAGELQLNAADLAYARQLLEAHKESKDPGPMYDFLASKGDRYAILAKGVAREDSIAGGMAIHNMESVGGRHNKPLTETDIKNIRYDMAHGYLNTQQNRLYESLTGIIYGDIDHKQAAQFHDSVFEMHGLPAQAWTLTEVFNAMTKDSRPIYWEQTLSTGGRPFEELKHSFKTYQLMAYSSSFGPDDIQKSSREWLDRMDSLPGYWAFAKSGTSQLFSTDDTPPVFIGECPIDITINPTPQTAMRVADENQARRDVSNGYLVNKPTHSFSFSDRF